MISDNTKTSQIGTAHELDGRKVPDLLDSQHAGP
jgi:hypothetical protein